MFARLPREVSIYEVCLRDGLQNERRSVPTQEKIRLGETILRTGLRRVELSSFVRPTWIPQLADAEEVVRAFVGKYEGIRFSALVPNERGLERALGCALSEVAVFMSASETHNRKNINRGVGESLALMRTLVPSALRSGCKVRAYLSTVWGCPYEGAVAVDRAVGFAEELLACGCYEVSLGDTIGCGTPLQTARLLEEFMKRFDPGLLAMHMHDTRGMALANILVGLEMGIRTFDSALGGLGGCPYAPGATGNVATEELAFMLEEMGIATGIDLSRALVAVEEAARLAGHALTGKLLRAGLPVVRFHK